jgi:hypothetical protein
MVGKAIESSTGLMLDSISSMLRGELFCRFVPGSLHDDFSEEDTLLALLMFSGSGRQSSTALSA